MRIVVLCNPDSWYFLDLVRAGASRHEIVALPFETLAASVDQGMQFSLSADCIIARTMPAGSLEQIVFRMDCLSQLQQSGALVINSPRAIEAAVDKYLSLSLLKRSGLPVPPTCVSQELSMAMKGFHELGGEVVVKPIFGSLGRGLVRLRTNDQAEDYFRELIDDQRVIYQQRFIPHPGYDVRLLVLGDRVWGMKRTNHQHWITNISQGGVGEVYQASPEEKEMALRAARAVGAHFAGVDLIMDSLTGDRFILEVNAVPGWRAIAGVVGVDIAAELISEIENLVDM
jgi:RimK family alpha-L-glutamate ligase